MHLSQREERGGEDVGRALRSETRPLVPLVGLPRVELGPLLRARLAAGDALFGLAQLGLVVVH